MACQSADVGDRGQKYSQGQMSFTLGMVWQVVKSMFMTSNKTKTS